MDIIESMRGLLKEYQNNLNSHSILENVTSSNNFIASVNEIRSNMIITKDEIPSYVPILTPSDMINEGLIDDITDRESEWFENYRKTLMVGADASYGQMVREAYAEYLSNDSEINRRKLLHLGWIPGIEPNAESFVSARDNLYAYIEATAPRVIDLTETTSKCAEVPITESATGEKLYPIYLVCTYTYTTFGKLVTSITSAKYSHSAIGFESDLKRLYSYNMNSKTRGGLSFESIDGYLKDASNAMIYVQVVFVTKKQYNKIRSNIDWYIANYNSSKYAIGNLFNIVVNRSKNVNHDLSMICSQFVDSMLKLINIDITNKSSNLVTPEDIAEVKNPTVYKLYEGLAKDYNPKKIQAMVNKLEKNAMPGISTVYEAARERYDDTTVLAIYETISSFMTAKSVFTEENIPIEITDNGDLSIATYKNYEVKYQEIHTLLKKVTNTESMKDEVCKLWWINCKLEKKIQACKAKGKKDVAKDYYKLRSRVLNDFSKYLGKIEKEDKEFNFSEYYKNSDYYDGSKVIKNTTLKGIGKLIKSIAV